MDDTTIINERTVRYVQPGYEFRRRIERALGGQHLQDSRTGRAITEHVTFVYTPGYATAVYEALETLAKAGVFITSSEPDSSDLVQAYQQGRIERGDV